MGSGRILKIYNSIKSGFNSGNYSSNNITNGSSKKSPLRFVLLILILSGAFFLLGRITTPTKAVVLGNRASAPASEAKETLNKKFEFPVKDGKGKEVAKLKFAVESTQLQNEIIVKGQKATAVKGKTFLIINIKLTNDTERSMTLNSRDYIRLIVNDKKEFLAPDIHNDPVDVQAISTKYTRVGFPIYESDNNLKLQVGEINGKKETIKLNLK